MGIRADRAAKRKEKEFNIQQPILCSELHKHCLNCPQSKFAVIGEQDGKERILGKCSIKACKDMIFFHEPSSGRFSFDKTSYAVLNKLCPNTINIMLEND